MTILGIETSGTIGSVAICSNGEVMAQHTFREGARHARDIMTGIDAVLKEARARTTDIDAIAVSEGPGSFTGLRVGVTCAKTLAYALGCKVTGVPSLEVLAQNVSQELMGGCEFTCPLLDARRSCVYWNLFQWEGGCWHDRTAVMVGEPLQIAERIPAGTLIFGSGLRAYPEVFGADRFRCGSESLERGLAEQVARLGALRVLRGGAVEPALLTPKYYRITEAEEKIARRPARGRPKT